MGGRKGRLLRSRVSSEIVILWSSDWLFNMSHWIHVNQSCMCIRPSNCPWEKPTYNQLLSSAEVYLTAGIPACTRSRGFVEAAGKELTCKLSDLCRRRYRRRQRLWSKEVSPLSCTPRNFLRIRHGHADE